MGLWSIFFIIWRRLKLTVSPLFISCWTHLFNANSGDEGNRRTNLKEIHAQTISISLWKPMWKETFLPHINSGMCLKDVFFFWILLLETVILLEGDIACDTGREGASLQRKVAVLFYNKLAAVENMTSCDWQASVYNTVGFLPLSFTSGSTDSMETGEAPTWISPSGAFSGWDGKVISCMGKDLGWTGLL